jgi:hypothetical protein
MTEFNLTLADAAKRAALNLVTKKEWADEARFFLLTLPPGWEGTGEDIRRFLVEDMSLDPPHHHNAWGGLISGALRRGTITGTGKYRKMTSVRSHARKTEVYRRGY